MRNKGRISHYNIKLKTMSHGHKSIGYNKQCILGGFLVDPIPNSPNSHHKNCIADSKENYQ